ncbi:LolA family protein [Ornithinibacillus halophilus]|uniref:Outer membrane lipoprotein-sorting protein n=1 Tax=Ornithinibacillus halophilus TaxID=930117 RepID=A0A1M5IVN5_9BACI|nr:outer membrane lipoprotein carrier protein LolA [Ornithinibacillus halophilus]SHG32099.1 Outer membrane lipoprotein-sorting protein [Ornithinibacillus halophilus]
MFKKVGIRMIIVFGLVLLLSACGEKSQEDVLEELQENIQEISGYKANAEMKMNTGQEEQAFSIEVWHKKEDFYRVALSNESAEKESQIILKNEDGVFVLTPELNKSFKFQSEWPENSSQPYLYESLVGDIVEDSEATFTSDDNNYIFKTKTNYQSNSNLPYQEIYIDKQSLAPVLINVLDKDDNTRVTVSFTKFEMNPSFGEKDFDMEENMANARPDDVPASGDVTETAVPVLSPVNTVGAQLNERIEQELENGKRIISTYTGEKNFTLVQEKLDVVPTLSSPKVVEGDIVNLGHTHGVLSEGSLEWDYEGMSFLLASDELTRAELIEVAQSIEVAVEGK